MPVLCVLIAMAMLLRCYRDNAAQGRVMLATIVLTIGAIWIPDVLALVPLLWLGTRALYCSSVRTTLASLMGVAVVALYVGIYCFWQYDSTFTHDLIDRMQNCFVREGIWMRPIWEMIVLGISTIIGLIYTIRHGSKFSTANVRIQARYLAVSSLWVVTSLLAFYPQAGALSMVIIATCAATYLFGLYHRAYGFQPIPWRKIFPRKERRSRFNKRSRRAFKYYRIGWIVVVVSMVACGPNNKPKDEPEIPEVPQDTIQPEEPQQPTDTIKPQPEKPIQPEDMSNNRDLAYLFDLNTVAEITITVTEDNWNLYLQHLDENINTTEYVPAEWTYTKAGVTYHRDSVGLRPRGNTSRRRPEGETGEVHQRHGANWHHAHFGVRFNEYESGHKFFGMDRVVLKWHKDDSNYCREIFCYDLFRRFDVWSAPRACYCRLSLYVEGDDKPVYLGVYELIEGVRSGYLDDRKRAGHIPDKDGNLWKAAWGADLSDPSKSMGVSDDWTNYTYNLKTNKSNLPAAQSELQNFIRDLSYKASGSEDLRNWLEGHIDVDLFLRAYAVNVMVGMWDDYWINNNNFYFYFDSQHRMYFIPYDYDNTLGTSGCNIDAGMQDMLNWGSRGYDRMLMRKVLSIHEYEERYKAYIKELASSSEYMAAEAAIARVRSFQQLVAPYVANDTGEDMTIEDLPASWSNMHSYRLLSGRAGDNDDHPRNFFYTKIQSINF